MTGRITDRKLRENLNLVEYPRTIIPFLIISAYIIVEIPSIMSAVKMLVMIQIMIYASFYDAATHKVDRMIPLLIISIGSINITPALNESMLGLFVLPALLIIMNQILKPVIGQTMIAFGDILMIGALGYTLGIMFEAIALIIGMMMSLGYVLVLKNQKERIALVPFISLGNIALLMITIH